MTRPVQSRAGPAWHVPLAEQLSGVVQNLPSLQAPLTLMGKQPSQQALVVAQTHTEVAVDAEDSTLKPRRFCAATVKVYWVPEASPVMVADSVVELVVTAPGVRVMR